MFSLAAAPLARIVPPPLSEPPMHTTPSGRCDGQGFLLCDPPAVRSDREHGGMAEPLSHCPRLDVRSFVVDQAAIVVEPEVFAIFVKPARR